MTQTTQQGERPRIIELAERIEADIRQRGLQPGARYMTGAEVARWLKVDNGTAHRAMQLLAQRRIIDRRQRKGCFIAEPAEHNDESAIDTVYLVVPRNYMSAEGLYTDGVVIGLQRVFPGVNLQFSFLPPHDTEEFLERLIRSSLASGDRVAFVLVRSTLECQRLMLESGLHAVVHGSVFPAAENMSSVDKDNFKVGHLMADWLIRQRSRRFLVIRRERITAGEVPYLDGVLQTLGNGRFGLADVAYRELPSDTYAVSKSVLQYLLNTRSSGDTRPLGIFARTERHAIGTAEAVEQASMRLGKDAFIVVADVYRRGNENPPPYPFIRLIEKPEEQGEHLGNVLLSRVKGQRPVHHLMDVELVNAEPS